MSKVQATFYRDSSDASNDAEKQFLGSMDTSRLEITSVNLSKTRDQIPHAEKSGVKSVPAFVIEGKPYHINHGSKLADIKS